MSKLELPNIAADPIGAVLILPANPDAGGAILLRQDGSAIPVAAIPRSDGSYTVGYLGEPITPQQVRAMFVGMTRIRRDAEAEIDRLIALLDRIGPDPDLEPSGDEMESSLGSSDAIMNQTRGWSDGGMANSADGSCADREQHDDDEPSLGSIGAYSPSNQGLWASTFDTSRKVIDLEDEHDGAEPEDDSEPSLGATEHINQKHWDQGDALIEDGEHNADDERPEFFGG